MEGIPPAISTDAEDVVWALQTADALWKRNERVDAIVWLRRAAQAAGDANDDDRAVVLARNAAELTELIAAAPRSSSGAPPMPPDSPQASNQIDALLRASASDFSPLPSSVLEAAQDIPVLEEDDASRASVPTAEQKHAGILDPWSEQPPHASPRSERPRPKSMAAPAADPVESEVYTSAHPPPLPPSKFPVTGESPKSKQPSSDVVSAGAPSAPVRSAPPAPASAPAPTRAAHPPLPPPRPPPLPKRSPGATTAPATHANPPSPPKAPPPKPPKPAPPKPATAAPPKPPASRPVVAAPVSAAPPAPEPPSSAVAPQPTAPDVPSSLPPPPSPRPTLVDDDPLPPEALPPATGVDLSTNEAFADLPDDARERFASAANVNELAKDEEVGAFALALVIRGEVDVAAQMVDAPSLRLTAGSVLRSRGSIDDHVAIRLICASDAAVVAIWNEEEVAAAFKTIPWVEDDLRAAADRTQALAGVTVGPLGERLDRDLRDQVTSRLEVRTYRPGDVIVEKGKSVPGIVIVAAGDVELVEGEVVNQTLGSGDFLFADAILTAGAAPLTARVGKRGAIVMFGSRALAQELLVTCPPLLEVFAGM